MPSVFAQDDAITIEIDSKTTYQAIEGFGTCLISWGPFPGEVYTPEFVRDFYLGEVGLNIVRESLNGFLHPEVEDPREISADRIELDNGGQIFANFSKEAKKADSSVRIIGSVWSPPKWMKLNRADGNQLPGNKNEAILATDYRGSKNRVDPEKYEHFVAWLVAVAEWHKREGIALYAVSPTNEPRFSQWYGSCVWTAEDLAKVTSMLGEALEEAGLGDILIFAPEDMTGHLYQGGTSTMVEVLMTGPSAEHIDRLATHGYTDGVVADVSEESSAKLWELIEKYDKPYWMTEGGTKGHDWPEPVKSGVAQAIHNSLVGGNASAFVPWQISEKEKSTHGLAVRNTATKKTYATMHFSRTIPVGSQRIQAEPGFGTVQASAYRHPETGALSIVMINPQAEEQKVVLKLRGLDYVQGLTPYRTTAEEDFKEFPAASVQGGEFPVMMPPESIVSLTAGQ